MFREGEIQYHKENKLPQIYELNVILTNFKAFASLIMSKITWKTKCE